MQTETFQLQKEAQSEEELGDRQLAQGRIHDEEQTLSCQCSSKLKQKTAFREENEKQFITPSLSVSLMSRLIGRLVSKRVKNVKNSPTVKVYSRSVENFSVSVT